MLFLFYPSQIGIPSQRNNSFGQGSSGSLRGGGHLKCRHLTSFVGKGKFALLCAASICSKQSNLQPATCNSCFAKQASFPTSMMILGSAPNRLSMYRGPFSKEHFFKGQMNQVFDILSFAILKQPNAKRTHY